MEGDRRTSCFEFPLSSSFTSTSFTASFAPTGTEIAPIFSFNAFFSTPAESNIVMPFFLAGGFEVLLSVRFTCCDFTWKR